MVVKEVAQLIREGAEKMIANFVFCFVFAKEVEQLMRKGAREMIGLVLGYTSNCWLMCPRSNIQVDM